MAHGAGQGPAAVARGGALGVVCGVVLKLASAHASVAFVMAIVNVIALARRRQLHEHVALHERLCCAGSWQQVVLGEIAQWVDNDPARDLLQ